MDLRALVEAMLKLAEDASLSIRSDSGIVVVSTKEDEFRLELASSDFSFQLERLATCIEAKIMFRRATAMQEAAGEGEGPPPLWLVSGSSVLAKWLAWSGMTRAFLAAIKLTDQPGSAPVAGRYLRRARRDMGQGLAEIRVRGALAVATRIELSERPLAIAILGNEAILHIYNQKEPESRISALRAQMQKAGGMSLSDAIAHPFFKTSDLMLAALHVDGSDTVAGIRTQWGPLAPIPTAALAILPKDRDAEYPWALTLSERRALDDLMDEGRLLELRKA